MIRLVAVVLTVLAVWQPAPALALPEQDLQALAARMRAAVLARDERGYLALADLSDPVFALEHARWARDGAERPVRSLELGITSVEAAGDQATAELDLSWETADARRLEARVPVAFRRIGGQWRFGGERWTTIREAGFVVRAAPGLEPAARAWLEALPEVHERVAERLGFAPAVPPELKLYASGRALSALVQLNLPPVSGWNEPGEALKVVASPDGSVVRSTLAHELTHSFAFERFGAGQTQVPWWAHEGLAQLVASSYWSPEQTARYLERSVAWQSAGELADWAAISDFPSTPTRLWPQVYAQGYALLRYIEQTFGPAARTGWLAELAAGRSQNEAASAAFGQTFTDLERDLRAWLATQTLP